MEEYRMKLDGGGGGTQYIPMPAKEEEPEPTRPKKKKRPTLLTQMEGLLTGQGTEKSLIGGKEG